MSAEETVLINLLDSYWFEYGFFTEKPPLKTGAIIQETEEEKEEEQLPQKQKQNIPKEYPRNNITVTQISPDGTVRQLPIVRVSQKYSHTVELEGANYDQKLTHHTTTRIPKAKKATTMCRKSLSELEFEELKGFMDMGFVFRPEQEEEEEEKMDKYCNYSRLVSIVPGLQIFRHSTRRDHVSIISRPYLSESWDFVLKKKKLLDYWRIPAFVNEIEFKNHLRFWAHSVLSTATSSSSSSSASSSS